MALAVLLGVLGRAITLGDDDLVRLAVLGDRVLAALVVWVLVKVTVTSPIWPCGLILSGTRASRWVGDSGGNIYVPEGGR